MKGGAMIDSATFNKNQGLNFQKALMRLQASLEDVFFEIAQMGSPEHPKVILIDRGLLDGSAYVD